MNIGDVVKLSHLSVENAGIILTPDGRDLRGPRFVVVRIDRSFGITHLIFEDEVKLDVVWDEWNPTVRYLGKGKVKTTVTFEDNDQNNSSRNQNI